MNTRMKPRAADRTRWHPNTCPKQDLLRDICRTKKFVLAEGPRYASKSVGAYHCLADHAWRTHPGNIAIVTISQTVGKDSGVWDDITKHVLPEWIGEDAMGVPWTGKDWKGNPVKGGRFGMKWVKKPYTENVTKKPTCEVSNYAGGVTKIQLDSLQIEAEVEDRFKPRRYSMIYVPELTTFQNMMTFATWTECLRMIGLPEPKHLFLADTNPPDDSSWWIHDLWWDLLECPDEDVEEFISEHKLRVDVVSLLIWKRSMARVHFDIEDNLFRDEDHVALLKAKYAHNDELYRRYILGECVRTTMDSVFAEVFRPSFHVVGETETKANKDNCEEMFPEEDCFELKTTWDPGSGTNWACQVGEKFFPTVEKYGPMVAKYKDLPCFKVLDEVMCLDADVDTEEFVNAVLEKMDFYQKLVGRPIRWLHYADRSVYDMKDIQSGKYYVQIIHELSGGRIALIGVEKKGKSVQAGIDLMRRLFFEERIWLNAARCPITIAALKAVKKPRTGLAAIAKGSKYKHPVDSLRYWLQAECYAELDRQVWLNIRKRRDADRRESGSLVEISL